MDRFKEFKSYFENFITGIVFHDAQTKVLFANSSALNLLGLTFNQMLGKDAMDSHWRFIREDGSDLSVEDYPVSKVLSTKSRIENIVLGIVRTELSQPIWVICNGHPEFDQDGNIDFVVISFSDVSTQKETEERLGEQLKLTQALIDSMLDGISIVNAEGTQIDANPAFLKMTGFTREELIGTKPPFPYWPPEEYETIFQAFQKTLGEKSGNFELIFMRKNQERFPVLVSPSSVLDKSGNVQLFIASVKDISKIKETERQLKDALESAETAVKVKSRFLDMAAHELKTPVSSVSMVLQYARKKLEKETPVDLETLDRLLSQTDRISQLVVDLMNVSRLERGVLKLRTSNTDLLKLVNDCADDFRLRDPNREIKVLHEKSLYEANIDSVRIFQVLSNLLDNALKYTPAQSAVVVSLEKKPTEILISVIDQGEGIPEDKLAILFDPFSRGDSTFTEKTEGLGLGLYICQEILSLHNGQFGAKSTPGQGSKFYFSLPLGEK